MKNIKQKGKITREIRVGNHANGRLAISSCINPADILKYNYSVKAKVRDIIDDLTDEERECLNPKYDVKLAKYKKLSEDKKWDLNEYVTAKPGKPTIEIKTLADMAEE